MRSLLAQGRVALRVSVGGALSNAASGYVVQLFGYDAGFLFLAAIAVTALAFFWLLMPEQQDTPAATPA